MDRLGDLAFVKRSELEALLADVNRAIALAGALLDKLAELRAENESLRKKVSGLEKDLSDSREELLALEERTSKELVQRGEALRQLKEAILRLVSETKAELER